MEMVVTLRSGAQIRAGVKKFSTETEGGRLTNIRWTTEDRPDTKLNWVNISEVAAIHAEKIQD